MAYLGRALCGEGGNHGPMQLGEKQTSRRRVFGGFSHTSELHHFSGLINRFKMGSDIPAISPSHRQFLLTQKIPGRNLELGKQRFAFAPRRSLIIRLPRPTRCPLARGNHDVFGWRSASSLRLQAMIFGALAAAGSMSSNLSPYSRILYL